MENSYDPRLGKVQEDSREIQTLPSSQKLNGNSVSDPKLVNDIFAEHFANVSSKDKNKPFYRQHMREESHFPNITTQHSESYNMPFDMTELLHTIAKSKNTAPGPDEIIYDMIKQSSLETKQFILGIINRIFRNSEFPSIWEMAMVVPFLKPGKDPTLLSNYQPIALTSCLCKLMERMVNTRLVWFLERTGLFSSSQCGFRRMHSCIDVLMRLESSTCKAFVSKQHHITVF